jgi:hypothetical protein
MIEIVASELDAPEFLERVRRAIGGAVALHRPAELRIVRIDDWFDSKWLRFSGKTLGAVGVYAASLTVPPFHPHRVVEEARYVADPIAGYRAAAVATPLHLEQRSERNLVRRAADVAPGAVLAWYSARSAVSRRGSLMLYAPDADGIYSAWYAAFVDATPDWRLTRVKGISRSELGVMEQAAVEHTS